jgi:signal transduction histidine kinase
VGGLIAAVVLVTVALAMTDARIASPVRHAYFAPVAVAALRFGLAGGVLAAGGAILGHAPFVLSAVERSGPGVEMGETLATWGLLVGIGALGGALAAQARRSRARYLAALDVQRALALQRPLPELLDRVEALLRERLGLTAVHILVGEAGALLTARPVPASASALATAVLDSGRTLFVPDAGTDWRPRRVLATPLIGGEGAVGALVVERLGELGRSERAGLATLGVEIGLGLETARLAARLRHQTGELADRVASATRHLVELDRARSTFVAVASHELRTPLTAVLGFAELLVTRDVPPPEVRRLAGTIRAEAERLTRMVADLLDLSRLERGLPPPLRPAPVCIAQAIGATLDLFRHQRPRHELIADCPEPVSVEADPDAIDRILRNLVSNAVKYAPSGTRIRVAACRRPDRRAAEIRVEDQGRGIAPEDLPRVFEPYFRAPGTAAAPGAGIGLAVVRSLVEAHGGSVSIESAPDRGTRVMVWLPERLARHCPDAPGQLLAGPAHPSSGAATPRREATELQ